MCPIVLNDEISGIKATVDFDEEVGEFVFDINGEPFENLPFLDSSFSLDDKKTKVLCAKVSINEKVISEGGKEWLPTSMLHAIWEKIKETEPITSVKVENIRDTTTATMNELIGLLVIQENIPEEGL